MKRKEPRRSPRGAAPWRSWLGRKLPGAARVVSLLPVLSLACILLPSLPRFPSFPLPTPGNTLERRLPLGIEHRYGFRLRKGEFLELAVDQQRVDVVLTLAEPWRWRRLPIDRPDTTSRPERLLLLAPEGGKFELRVAPLRRGGRYRLTTRARRPAGVRDRLRTEAFASFHEGLARALAEPEAAVPLLEQAARRWREVGERTSEALALREEGKCLVSLGRPAAGEAVLRASIAAALVAGHRDQEALSRRALARLFEGGVGDGRARALLGQARDLFHALALGADEAEAWNALAWQAQHSMELGEAETAFRSALGLYRRIGDRAGEAKMWLHLGYLEAQLGDAETALERFQKHHAMDPHPGSIDRAFLLEGEGTAFQALGRTEDARAAFIKALELRPDQPAEDRLFAVNGLAKLDFHDNRWEAAAERLEQALALTADPQRRATLLQNLATCLWRGGELERARGLYRQALDLARQTGLRQFEAAALGGLARVAFAEKRYDEASEWVKQALENVERFRDSTPRLELRTALFSDYQELFDLAIDILLARNGGAAWSPAADEAFLFSERSRARRLLDILAFSAGESGKARLVGRPEVERELLDGDTAFLELDVSAERAVLFLLTREERRVVRLLRSDGIEEKAGELAEALPKADRLESRHRSETGVAELSKALLEPVAAALAGKRRLWIVPDGSLHSVPFGALRWPAGSPLAGQLLADTHEVVTAPSASTAVLLRRLPPRSSATKLWLIADPVFQRNDERFRSPDASARGGRTAGGTRSAENLDDTPLSRLAFAEGEAKGLLALVPPGRSRVARDFDATREHVLGGLPGGAEIVSFITHGVYDPRRPEYSWLALSRYDRAGRKITGHITALDVRKLSLPADLVVLSACETAKGRRVPGEGLLGLSHAFFEAGSRANVVTLWKVDDEATSFLMESFYQGLLGEGLSPAAAMRRAQRALRSVPGRELWQNPYYWAAFLVQGDGFYTKSSAPGFPSRTPSSPGF